MRVFYIKSRGGVPSAAFLAFSFFGSRCGAKPWRFGESSGEVSHQRALELSVKAGQRVSGQLSVRELFRITLYD